MSTTQNVEIERARQYQTQKLFTKASLLYLKALPVQEAFEGLVESLLARDRVAEAIGRGEEALSRSIATPRLRLALGRAYLRANRGADAIVQFDAAAAVQPNDAATRLAVGDALAATGKFSGAIESYRKAAELSATPIEAGLRLYDLHIQRGEIKEAAERLEQVVKSDRLLEEVGDRLPHMLQPFAQDDALVTRMDQEIAARAEPAASLVWARALLANAHAKPAFRHVLIVLESELVALHTPALEVLSRVVGTLEPEASMASELETALRKSNTPTSLFNLAYTYSVADRLNDAVAAVRDALFLDEEGLTIFEMDHVLRLEDSKLKSLVAALQDLLKAEKDPPFDRWGLLFLRLNLHAEAIACFERARDPGVVALTAWGHALVERHALDEALDKYLRALEGKPTFAPWGAIADLFNRVANERVNIRRAAAAALATLPERPGAEWTYSAAELYLSGGADLEYEERFGAAVRATQRASALLTWAAALERMHKLDAAKQLYQECAELDPDSGEPHYALAQIHLQAARTLAGLHSDGSAPLEAYREGADYDLTAFRAEIDSAIGALQSGIDANPELTKLYEAWGDALELMESGAGVGRLLARALGTGPLSAVKPIDSAALANVRDESVRRAAQMLAMIERNCDARQLSLYQETAIDLIGKVGSSRVDLQACKLEYSIVSPK